MTHSWTSLFFLGTLDSYQCERGGFGVSFGIHFFCVRGSLGESGLEYLREMH